MPKNNKNSKHKKSAPKSSRKPKIPIPQEDSSDEDRDQAPSPLLQVRSDDEQGQALSSPSRSKTPSRSGTSSRARTPAPESSHDNDDFDEETSNDFDLSNDHQVSSSHPQPNGEAQLPSEGEVTAHPPREVLAHPPREVRSSPSIQSESDDSDVQFLGQTPVEETSPAPGASQAEPSSNGGAGKISEISRSSSATAENVANSQCVSDLSKSVKPTPKNSPAKPSQGAAQTNLLPSEQGERAQSEREQPKQRKKEAINPPDNSGTATVQRDPAGKGKSQASTDAGKAADQAPKPASKRNKHSGSPQSGDLADLKAMVQALQEQVNTQNAKLSKQAQAAILSEERYREMRERELENEDARATAQDDQIEQLQAQLEEAAKKQAAPAKFVQLDDPEFASRFKSLMKTGLYSLESVRTALETTVTQQSKMESTAARALMLTSRQF
jgi:hypothetical protein